MFVGGRGGGGVFGSVDISFPDSDVNLDRGSTWIHVHTIALEATRRGVDGWPKNKEVLQQQHAHSFSINTLWLLLLHC